MSRICFITSAKSELPSSPRLLSVPHENLLLFSVCLLRVCVTRVTEAVGHYVKRFFPGFELSTDCVIATAYRCGKD